MSGDVLLNPKDHPVGTRALVNQSRAEYRRTPFDPTREVEVLAWSPTGRLKVEWCSGEWLGQVHWYDADRLHMNFWVVEVLGREVHEPDESDYHRGIAERIRCKVETALEVVANTRNIPLFSDEQFVREGAIQLLTQYLPVDENSSSVSPLDEELARIKLRSLFGERLPECYRNEGELVDSNPETLAQNVESLWPESLADHIGCDVCGGASQVDGVYCEAIAPARCEEQETYVGLDGSVR